MDPEIITRDFDLPVEFEAIIKKKYQRLFHYSNRIMSGRMIIGSDGSNYQLEFLLKLRGGQLSVHTKRPNLLVGINNLFDKLRRRLKREEEKLKEHRPRS
ncbi:hypothetical protein DRP53_07440 [candidate division WOR-3 bacterium]|uniref:HPF/RaiA family ribosome-associated protein n=1 Tax=candidate division WOR-3 bacterium TaxID=2052148 RepID=A0A660SGH3_UNCW3|nr:MAG: hypothetical protein DRP53_07440 [candidate division WOR-3 bacterium]